MEIYEVANIEEAVELADKLKAEGRYNWFRGQVKDWPPVSSLHRSQSSKDPEKEEKSARRISMFYGWINEIPELRYLHEPERIHDFFAIMQHYGIPTHYIDFTTDPGVAGFFAADTGTPPTEGMSCIYCLNTDDLMSCWDDIKDYEREGANIELVTIDVRNLWRLQAQKGVFLFANYNWDIDYPMDRILFPYSGYPSYPTRERIYPEHKSPLEQLLDQYFSLEASTFTNEKIQQWFKQLRSRGVSANYMRWETWQEGFYPEAFINGASIVPLESWSPEALLPWEVYPKQDYHQVVGPTVKLKLKSCVNVDEVRKSVSFGVKQILRSDPTIRFKTVDWLLTELPESLSQEDLNKALRPVWDGMRRLPYVDEEIADAIASITVLFIVGFGREATIEGQMRKFSQYFGECIRVGFANLDGSDSRGLAARESLRRALRSDITELVVLKYKEFVNDIHELFRIIYNPRLMFEFNEFKKIFAREVIPVQVMLQRSLILFNPAQLMTFGNP